jgi:exodeoxyribonuclease V alpha subunit
MMRKAQPGSSPSEVLAGLVERVTYHNAENGFCVLRAKARGHRDVVTVVGHAATISAGEWITASGQVASEMASERIVDVGAKLLPHQLHVLGRP